MNGSSPKVTWLSRESRPPAYNARTAVSEPLGPRSFMQTPSPDGERRALRALIYLAIFFPAWLLAFLLDPLATSLMRAAGWMPRAVAVLLVYFGLAVLLVVFVVVIADTLAASITALGQTAP